MINSFQSSLRKLDISQEQCNFKLGQVPIPDKLRRQIGLRRRPHSSSAINQNKRRQKIILEQIQHQVKQRPSTQNQDQRPVWFSKSRSAQQINDAIQAQLIKKVCCVDYKYDNSPFLPGIDFIKILFQIISNNSLNLNVPDMLIDGVGFDKRYILLNHPSKGLQIINKVKPTHLDHFIALLQKLQKNCQFLTEIPFAITKGPASPLKKLFNEFFQAKYEVKQKDFSDVMMQRYILPKGLKASKVRIFYDKDQIEIYTITNKAQLSGTADRQPEEKRIEIVQKQESRRPSRISEASSAEVNDQEQTSQTQFIPIEDIDDQSQFLRQPQIQQRAQYQIGGKFCGSMFEIDNFQLEKQPQIKRVQSILRRKTRLYSDQNLLSAQSFSQNQIEPSTSVVDLVYSNIQQEKMISPFIQVSVAKIYKRLQNRQLKVQYQVDEIKLQSYAMQLSEIKRLSENYCTKASNQSISQIYQVSSSAAFQILKQQSQELIAILNNWLSKQYYKCKITQIVMDFIQDRQDKWWFLKLKAFKFELITKIPAKLVLNRKARCQGDFCYQEIDEENKYVKLIKKFKQKKYWMKIKTIIECREQQQLQLNQMLHPKLYKKVEVCLRCFQYYRLYEIKQVKKHRAKRLDQTRGSMQSLLDC